MGSRGAHPMHKRGPPSPFYCFPFCHTRPILHPFLETLRWQFENGAVIYDELIRREFVARRLDRPKERGMIPIYIHRARTYFLLYYIFVYPRFIPAQITGERGVSIENNIDVAKSSRKGEKSEKFRLVKLI